MADLIDRKALMRADRESFVSIYELIKEAPAVDAVEVVRCKDCDHGHGTSREGIVYCCYHGKMIQMKSSDFCSYGERRTDATD